MADDDNASLRYLQKRVAELEERLTKAEVSRKEARRELATLKAAAESEKAAYEQRISELESEWEAAESVYSDLETERDQLKTIAEAPPDERITQLEQQIKLRDVKDKFAAIREQLNEGVDLDRLWKNTDFDPAKVDLAELKVDEVVKTWRESAPFLFKPEGQGQAPAQGGTKPPLKTALESTGRGARDSATGRVTLSRSELREPGWERRHPAFADAVKRNDGSAVITED